MSRSLHNGVSRADAREPPAESILHPIPVRMRRSSRRGGVSMVMWRVIAPGLVGMLICGCQPPTGIVPAAPPGIEVERKAPDSEQPAEALGEAVVTRPAARTGASGSAAAAEIADLKPATPTAKGETKTTASGVKYETLREGTGPEA